jgi:hypothetical protein
MDDVGSFQHIFVLEKKLWRVKLRSSLEYVARLQHEVVFSRNSIEACAFAVRLARSQAVPSHHASVRHPV